jgi:hypothetical protein
MQNKTDPQDNHRSEPVLYTNIEARQGRQLVFLGTDGSLIRFISGDGNSLNFTTPEIGSQSQTFHNDAAPIS